jgi:predicted RecA/RadA family phage recombinase
MKAVFYQKGESIDFRPETDVAAGEVVVQGGLVGVTRLDCPAGQLGSLAICGVFKVAKKAEAISAGDVVYWDSNAATATSGSVVLGIAVADAASAANEVLVLLNGVNAAKA